MLFRWIWLISVEPVLFLYMMAFMITSVVEQDFFLQKSCLVNHGHDEDICNDLKNVTNSDINNQVQVC